MPAFEVANDAVQARAVRLFGAEQSSRLLDGQEYAAIAYSNKHGLLVYLAGDAVACASAAQLEAVLRLDVHGAPTAAARAVATRVLRLLAEARGR